MVLRKNEKGVRKVMFLSIENLKVSYGKDTVLDIAEPIHIDMGDRIGIIGSNGAGKSTLIKSILGLVKYEGSIQSCVEPWEMAAHMQFNEYTDAMPVKYVMEAILNTTIKNDKKLQTLIEYFDFEPCLKKKYKHLSGGQKQRFTIIMVMMQNAPLTFYDEVTSGLDFETRQKLVERLVSWYQDKELTLCIVSHYYEELERLVDKILILEKGKVVDYGLKEELFRRYCGKTIIILENKQQNKELVKAYKHLAAPEHLIAISCNSLEDEQEITNYLSENNVNFKRSNSDIEIMSINAKEQFMKRRENVKYEL